MGAGLDLAGAWERAGSGREVREGLVVVKRLPGVKGLEVTEAMLVFSIDVLLLLPLTEEEL